VIGRIEQRMAALGKGWEDTTATQIYSVHPFPAEEFVRRGAAHHGLAWHYTRPPVQGLEFEVDCRSVPVEHHVRP
jgi:hypothetical protein